MKKKYGLWLLGLIVATADLGRARTMITVTAR